MLFLRINDIKMKVIRLLFALSVFFYPNCIDSQQEVYPSLDRKLISLWESASKNDLVKSKSSLQLVKDEWSMAEQYVSSINHQNFNSGYFKDDTRYLLNAMTKSIEDSNFQQLEDFSYQMLWDFSSMRDCIGVRNHPIDQLLKTHITYSEIHYTVHDEMMGLKYWFEFQELVEIFEDYWNEYDNMSMDAINSYFGEISQEKHIILKKTVNDCLAIFMSSLDSGNRTDFEMPCDDMGDALNELIWLYSYN